ncbi:MAG: hypothetical protein M1832_002796 [Thelocarpon impressellum]|nr:MAG: hypothetical protein M1832_002796 [Thelocarpon impressellum]
MVLSGSRTMGFSLRIKAVILPLVLLLAPATTATPANATHQLSKRDDCDWAGKYQPYTEIDCYHAWKPGMSELQYVVQLTGTGQDGPGWCQGILDNIKGECSHPKLKAPWKGPGCTTDSVKTKVFAVDGDKGWKTVDIYGIELRFEIGWPWNEKDANHECVAKAVRKATCVQVEISNGAHCVSKGWDSEEVTAYWTGVGPA